jgi:hypothetical protein
VRDRDLGESPFRGRWWLDWRVEIGEFGGICLESPRHSSALEKSRARIESRSIVPEVGTAFQAGSIDVRASAILS